MRTMRQAIRIAAELTGVPEAEITGPACTREVVRARWLAIALRPKRASNVAVARALRKDHTTVAAARRRIPEVLAEDREFRRLVARGLGRIINGSTGP